MTRDLVRVHRGLYLAPADALDASDATRRIPILDARGVKVGYHQWDPLASGRLRLAGRSVSAAEEIAVDRAIGRLHVTSRLVASADGCLAAAERSGGSVSAGVLMTTALSLAGKPGFPPDVAAAVHDRVTAMCGLYPLSPWMMGTLARLGQEAAA